MKSTFEILGRVASKKNSRRTFMSHGHMVNIPSVAYEKFKKDVLLQLGMFVSPIPSPYTVRYLFEMKGKLSSDVDNMMASINDVLMDANIIDDDKNILKGSFEKTAGHKEFKTYVEVISFYSNEALS